MTHLNITSNGTSAGVQFAGPVHVQIAGDLGGGTVALEVSIDGQDFAEAYSVTDEDLLHITLDKDFVLRLVTSGASSPDFDLRS